MPAKSTTTIKGYLPLHISLPKTDDDNNNNDSQNYMYIKEHRHTDKKSQNHTLFITNVPLIPNVLSRLFLRDLFERFGGTVDKVTVIHNPRRGTGGGDADHDNNDDNNNNDDDEDDEFRRINDPFGFGATPCDEGKFAHVSFASRKDMMTTMKTLSRHRNDNAVIPFDDDEIKELVSESQRVMSEERRQTLNSSEEEEEEEENDNPQRYPTTKNERLANLLSRYKTNNLRRSHLMSLCNITMTHFETLEDDDRRTRRSQQSQPDADGFVTVSYGDSSVGAKRDYDAAVGGFGGLDRAKDDNKAAGSKRRRKKKESVGAKELSDFYRFQTRESKKKSLMELRERFEEDLREVKKMKEEKKYRPFA